MMNEILKETENEVINCKKCVLENTRTNAVPGEGSSDANILFIGEAPGLNEDKKGRPFVGKAGKILDELLNSISLNRNDIYITNIIKCRPPNNRNPKIEEIKTCSPYLDKQIRIIKPKVICCLGNFATKYILEKYNLKNKIQGISKIKGNIFKVSTLSGEINIIPLYHPAVATYDPRKIDELKKDFEVIKDFI